MNHANIPSTLADIPKNKKSHRLSCASGQLYRFELSRMMTSSVAMLCLLLKATRVRDAGNLGTTTNFEIIAKASRPGQALESVPE